MSKISKKLGDRIRNFRSMRGLTQSELAEKAYMSFTGISQIERGEKSPTFDTMVKISEALGITVSELVNFSQTGNRNEELQCLIKDFTYKLQKLL